MDSLHQIVHAPTPQIKDINAAAPHELQRIVRRCLAKEPGKRYQSIKEVAIELDELKHELEERSELEFSAQRSSAGAESPTDPRDANTSTTQPTAPNTAHTEISHSTLDRPVSGQRN